jgi:carbon monoxide dehydrogenase subunit G
MQVRESILVDRPPEEVFAFIADPAKAVLWRSYLVASQGDSGAVGDRVRQTYAYEDRMETLELEVMEYKPPEHLSYKTEGRIRGRISFQCRPESGGTRVGMAISATVSGPAALFQGRIEKEADALLKSDLAKLKGALEGDA